MDCYLANLKILLAENDLDASEFSFLTNYSVTRCWIDESASDSFKVPVIYPAWFPNLEEVSRLYPALKVYDADKFSDFIGLIGEQLSRGPVVVPIDRYYLSYIKPIRHMGAHYILITRIFEDRIEFLDAFDQREHSLPIEVLELATNAEHNRIQHMGYQIIACDQAKSQRIKVTCELLSDGLNDRLAKLNHTRELLSSYSELKCGNNRLLRFWAKISLGGMIYSDFNGKNGRQENHLILSRAMPKRIVLKSRLVLICYAILARFLMLCYALKIVRFPTWRIYLTAYRKIIDMEISLYRLVAANVMCLKRCFIKGNDGHA